MRNKILIPYLFRSLSISVYAQQLTNCGNELTGPISSLSSDCSENSYDFLNAYGLKEHYVPIPNSDNDFVKTIHVNFHIWQRADSSGNLDNNTNNINRLKQIIKTVNNKYYSVNTLNATPLPYSTTFIENPNFKIVLDSIYFYQDITADSNYFYCNNDYFHNTKLDNYIENNYPERLRPLALHLVNGVYPGGAGWSDRGSILTLYRNEPDMNINDIHDWWYGQHLAHEIGHALDLWHTYDHHYLWKQNCKKNYDDFLWDVYDTTAIEPCSSMVSCNFCLIPQSAS